eukprot:2869555-Pyramimonas_sp.AAC.1
MMPNMVQAFGIPSLGTVDSADSADSRGDTFVVYVGGENNTHVHEPKRALGQREGGANALWMGCVASGQWMGLWVVEGRVG